MIIANAQQIERFIGNAAYTTGAMHDAEAAKVNAAVLKATNGKLPCYAARKGARGSFKWVSVGSSAVIARGEATKWLARFGVDINIVEAA